MGQDYRVWQRIAYVYFDTLQQLMARLNSPQTWNQHME
jgi:hypothetical protein